MKKENMELDCETGSNPTARIELIKDRWLKSKQDLEYAKYVEELIHLDFIDTIKSYRTIWDYRLPTIKAAIDDLKITDGRKKKPSINCLNTWIKEDFFPEVNVDIRVINIVVYGYDKYHWRMDFDINDDIYSIGIPDKKMLDSENFSHAYEGKFSFMHRINEGYIKVEHTDYTEEGMSKFIKAYFMEAL